MQRHSPSSREYPVEVMNILDTKGVPNRNFFLTVGCYLPDHEAIIVVREGEAASGNGPQDWSAVENMTLKLTNQVAHSPDVAITVSKVDFDKAPIVLLMAVFTTLAIPLGAAYANWFNVIDPPVFEWGVAAGTSGGLVATANVGYYVNKLLRRANAIAKSLRTHRSINRPDAVHEYATHERQVRIVPTRWPTVRDYNL